MKMYLYILIYGNPNNNIPFNNKYAFYSQFTYEVISTYYQNMQNCIIDKRQAESNMNEISAIVFKAFVLGRKNIRFFKCIKPLLKNKEQQELTFVHETFFEYFVSRYYLIQLNKSYVDRKVLSVFCCNYTNDFADFISAALKTKSDEERIKYANKLCRIYFCTLDNSTQELYYEKDIQKISQISQYVGSVFNTSNISNEEFFSLKYEIVFRLGRLNIYNEEVKIYEEINNSESEKLSESLNDKKLIYFK